MTPQAAPSWGGGRGRGHWVGHSSGDVAGGLGGPPGTSSRLREGTGAGQACPAPGSLWLVQEAGAWGLPHTPVVGQKRTAGLCPTRQEAGKGRASARMPGPGWAAEAPERPLEGGRAGLFPGGDWPPLDRLGHREQFTHFSQKEALTLELVSVPAWPASSFVPTVQVPSHQSPRRTVDPGPSIGSPPWPNPCSPHSPRQGRGRALGIRAQAHATPHSRDPREWLGSGTPWAEGQG